MIKIILLFLLLIGIAGAIIYYEQPEKINAVIGYTHPIGPTQEYPYHLKSEVLNAHATRTSD